MMLLASLVLLLAVDVHSELLVTISDVHDPADAVAAGRRARFHARDVAFAGTRVRGAAFDPGRPRDDDGRPHVLVTAPLIYALPNRGAVDGLLNAALLAGKVVLFDWNDGDDIGGDGDEDGLSPCEQARLAEHAGGVAVVVVDHAPRRRGGGRRAEKEGETARSAARAVDEALWRSLSIPAVVVRADRGARLRDR